MLLVDDPQKVMVKIAPGKERYIIRNISQLFDILMDAVDEINANFSIQVNKKMILVKSNNIKHFTDDFCLDFGIADKYFHNLPPSIVFCLSSTDQN